MFNVGLKKTQVPDVMGLGDIPLQTFYPTTSREHASQFGPFELMLAQDAPLAFGKFPLVAISHGNAGTPWVHRGLAKRLAQNGCIVILPEHVGNSKSNNEFEGTVKNLENRPRQLNLCIAHVKHHGDFVEAITETYAIGHSIGGYTVLAAAGAKPYAGPHETTSGKVEEIQAEAVSEISALVLMAPATMWFQGNDSFENFDVPTLVLTGGNDEITKEDHAEIVRNGMRTSTRVEIMSIKGAGHFSFQSPFPKQMISKQFPPSQDPTGFDRAAFQEELASRVLDFFGVR